MAADAKTTKISRLMWTEQCELLLRVTDLVKKLCEDPLNNNVQSSRTLIGMSDRPEPSVQDLSAGIAIAIAGRGRSSALRAGLEAGPEGRGGPRQDEVAIERRRKEQRSASKQRQVLITCVRALTRQVQ